MSSFAQGFRAAGVRCGIKKVWFSYLIPLLLFSFIVSKNDMIFLIFIECFNRELGWISV